MNNFTFYAPTMFAFGQGEASRVGALVRQFGGSKVLLVAGGGSVKKNGAYDAVAASLKEAGLPWCELWGVQANPRSGKVYEGIDLARTEGADFLLAIGGGSVIDSAKAIGYGLCMDGDVWDLYDHTRRAEGCTPIGVVLTIAASGSEMSDSSVITKEEGGIKRGYNGTLCKSHHIEDDMVELDLDTILDIADQPGTYLRTARCLDFLRPEMRVHAANNIREMGIDGIGGDGSYHGAMGLCELGIPCVGIPGTIDNDLAYTEMTLGYDTAVNSCIDDIRAIRATSRSHDRPGVVEVMGRHCGDIALKAAAGSGAEICLVPEVSWSIQEAADRLSRLIDMGNPRATVVVAEGAWDAMQPADWRRYLIENGAKGIHEDDPISTEKLALLLKYKCKCEARPTVLGYTQRGRTPSAYDSWFAFEAGNLAVNLLRNGIGNQVIGIKDGRVYYLPIIEALKQKREFNLSLYNMINSL